MGALIPGRDKIVNELLDPESTHRKDDLESSARRAKLDAADLAEVERAQTGSSAAPGPRKRSLIDRLLRRG